MGREKKRKLDETGCLGVVENKIRVSPPHKKQKNDVDLDDVDVATAACMDDKVIDRVNTDCLAQIFMHIPPFERPKVAQVCKKWNEALSYSWSSVKKVRCLSWRYEGDITNRGSRKPRCLKGLIPKCGNYLTEINIIGYDNSDIMPLIRRSCPHLVHLQMRFKHVKNIHFKHAFSHMPNLKSIKMIFECKSSIPTMLILTLKDIAGSLKFLSFFNWNRTPRNQKIPDLFTSVFAQLTLLQYFDLFGYRFPDE